MSRRRRRPSFDSDTMIRAALAKCGKVTLTAEECRAAKKQKVIADHGELSVWVVLTKDWDRWFNDPNTSLSTEPPGPVESFAVEPPQ